MKPPFPETEAAEEAATCLALARTAGARGTPAAPRLEQARAELFRLEKRLGTAVERPGDIEQAIKLGHEIRNLLCIEMLRRDGT